MRNEEIRNIITEETVRLPATSHFTETALISPVRKSQNMSA